MGVLISAILSHGLSVYDTEQNRHYYLLPNFSLFARLAGQLSNFEWEVAVPRPDAVMRDKDELVG
jgi:hypothetical protein